MRENPGALDKLYSMLNDAESLGLSRPARMRLIGIIGSLENEELDRFRSRFSEEPGDAGSRGATERGEPWAEPTWDEPSLRQSRY